MFFDIDDTPVHAIPAMVILPDDKLPFSGADGLHTDAFLRKLLNRLECLPDIMPSTTTIFLPKSLVRRYGKIATKVLNWWLQEAMETNEGFRGKCATLFLKILKML